MINPDFGVWVEKIYFFGVILFEMEDLVMYSCRIQTRIQNAKHLMYFFIHLVTKNQGFQCLWGGIKVLSRRKPGFDSRWDHHKNQQVI